MAAAYDIRILSRWLSSSENGLANALSRFDSKAVALLCLQLDVDVLIVGQIGYLYTCPAHLRDLPPM
jgi:hypothetical protein